MAEVLLRAVQSLQESQQAEIDGLRRLCAHVVRANSALRRDHASLCIQHQVLLDCLDQSGELRPKVRALRDAQRDAPLCKSLQSERCARAVAAGAGAAGARELHAASRACVELLAAPLAEVLASNICQVSVEDVRQNSVAVGNPAATLAIEEPLALAWQTSPEPDKFEAERACFLNLLRETWPYPAIANLVSRSLEPLTFQEFRAGSRAVLECVRHTGQRGARQEQAEVEGAKEVAPSLTVRIQDRRKLSGGEEQLPQEAGGTGEEQLPEEPAAPSEAPKQEPPQGSDKEQAEAGLGTQAAPGPETPSGLPVLRRWGREVSLPEGAAQEEGQDAGDAQADRGVEGSARGDPSQQQVQPQAEEPRGATEEDARREDEQTETERLEELAAEEQARKKLMEAERNRKQKAQKDAEVRRERQNGHAEVKPPEQGATEEQRAPDSPPHAAQAQPQETEAGKVGESPSPTAQTRPAAENRKELEEQARKKLMEAERNRKQKANQDAQAKRERERAQAEQEKAEQERKAKLEESAAEKRREEEARKQEAAVQPTEAKEEQRPEDQQIVAVVEEGRPPDADAQALQTLDPVEAEEQEERKFLRAQEEEEEKEKERRLEAEARMREQERERKAKAEAERQQPLAIAEPEGETTAPRPTHPFLPLDVPSDADAGEEGWAEIAVEDVFAEALSITWPGVTDMPVESYTIQARLARADGATAPRRGWTRAGVKEPQALLNELPEACDLEVRVAAYLEGVDPAQKPLIGHWFQVRTFELDLSVDKINVDPEGNLRGRCAESRCRGYISTEAQDPCTETESMPLCARCGVEFNRHCRLSADGEPIAEPAATPVAALPAPAPAPAPPAPQAAAPPAPAPSSAVPQVPIEEDLEMPADLKKYCIVSSWDDNWKRKRSMDWNKACKHYECNMEVSEDGEESFQILLEGAFDKCVHPNRQDACPHIDYKLCGPDAHGHELNWTIGKNTLDDAQPGDRFKIRFFVLDNWNPRLVDWQRLADSEQRILQERLKRSPLDIKNESTLYRKLRWNNLTEDLHLFYRAGETNAIEAPTGQSLPDEQVQDLTEVLAPVRERVTRTVREKLDKYDAGTQFPRPEDEQHAQREGYELDLLCDGLKDLRDTIYKHHNHGCMEQVWKIVGGENKGGLKVRANKALQSDEKGGLLATGSLVKEIALIKDRLNYKLLSGAGPEDGWISIKIKTKVTAVKVSPGELVEVAAEPALEQPQPVEAKPVDEEELARRRSAFLKEQQLRLAKACRLRQERDSASKHRAKADAARERCGACDQLARPSVDGHDESGSFRCNSCWAAHHRQNGNEELANRAKNAHETNEVAMEEERLNRQQLDKEYMKASLAEERLELRCASPGCTFCVHSDEAIAENHCCPGCAEGGPHCSACEAVVYFAEDEDLAVETPPPAPEPPAPKAPCFKPRPEEPIVIIGLMSSHISKQGRLDRFRHVLKSVKKQEILTSGTTFIFSLSWSSTEEFEDDVQSAVDSVAGPNMLAVHQLGRHSQFQHLRAAMVKAEDMLSKRWAAEQQPQGRPSIWVMFGDDDDIWHRRRVDSYAQAMRSHNMLDGVGIFVTTARALCQYGKNLSDADLPVDEASIESFMYSGRGKRMDKQPDTLEWQRICETEGSKVSTMQLPDELTLEYFDFCPRLRLMREFLSSTSEDLIAHRYCDLRFNEFLRLYPFKGRELGLEIAFLFPKCWMLFYATPIMEDDHVKKIVEKADSDTSVNVNNGHMSANYAVDRADDELGTRALPDFNHFDNSVSQKRLARYWAAFRNSVENYIVRHAGEKIDQRMFDLIVYISLQSSFFKFVERLDTMPDAKAMAGVTMMEYISQGYAKAVARKMDISVLWHRPNLFLEPPPKEEAPEAPGPMAPPLGKALLPHGPGYHGLQGHGYGAPHHGMPGFHKQGPPFGAGKPTFGSFGTPAFGNGHPPALHSHFNKGLHGQHPHPLGTKLFP